MMMSIGCGSYFMCVLIRERGNLYVCFVICVVICPMKSFVVISFNVCCFMFERILNFS